MGAQQSDSPKSVVPDGPDQLRSIVARVVTIQEGFANSLERLAEAQLRTEEAQRRTEEVLAQTDEKLNTLISIVDGMIRRQPPPQRA